MEIQKGFVIAGDAILKLSGVSDIEYSEIGGRKLLVVGSEGDSAITVFDVTDRTSLGIGSTIEYDVNTGTQQLSDLLLIPGASTAQVISLGRNDDNVGTFELAANGDLTQSASTPGVLFERNVLGAWAQFDGKTFVFATGFGSPGFHSHRLENSGTLSQRFTINDGSWSLLENVTALHYAELHDKRMLFSAGGLESGFHVFDVRDSGFPRFEERFGPNDNVFVDNVTDMGAVQIDERAFLVAASFTANALTVYRVSQGFQLNEVDVYYDTFDTRIARPEALEIFQTDDRTFVLAGGADDGVSLFELTYRGKLVHLASRADDFGTTLRAVSTIDVQISGETAYAYVGSSTESGLTELVIDLSRSGQDRRGGAVKDNITGTAGDDVIWGMGKSDTLDGGAGDDRLIDGRGRDTLIGGEGADIFEFVADGRSDFIEDFEPGIDRIDLSDSSADHISDVEIGARKRGAVIKIDDDIIRVYNPDGGPYDVSDWGADMFIFG
ncbi:MAG: M10 family metallopeptidase C-terminal domain-containing protein [Pseudomonadota bacterium]